MGCKAKGGCAASGVDSEQKKILKTLAGVEKPVAPKNIAESTGLESKTVSAKMKGLKEQGLVESPVRCKWSITDAGKKQLK